MSTEFVQQKVAELLASKVPEIVAVNGRWGVGKTFFWNKLIKDLARDKKIALPKYSYVSLFGIETLDQLKSAIFEQTIEQGNIVDGVTLKSVKENVIGFASAWDDSIKTYARQLGGIGSSMLRKGARLIGNANVPYVQGLSGLVRSGTFLLVKDTVVCIDDLERRGRNLEVREVLGLLSFLKEQRGCKVALIFNEDSLDEQSAKQYAEYREKVVDVELEYAPTVKEVVSKAIDSADDVFEHIVERAQNLGITNIRVIQKIKRMLDGLAPYLSGREKETLASVRGSLVLLCWAYFSRETRGPTLEFIRELGGTMLWQMEGKKEPNIFEKAEKKSKEELARQKDEEEKDRWRETLKQFGWVYTDELDMVLAEYVEQGYVNPNEMNARLDALDVGHKDAKGKAAIQKVWRKFHNSFQSNEPDFVADLATTIQDNCRYLGKDQLNTAVQILRELGHESDANKLVDVFVEVNKDRSEIFSVESAFDSGRTLDEYLRTKFFEARGVTGTTKQLADVLHRIGANNSWGGDDEEFLDSFSEDNLYEFFTSTESEYLHSYIRVLLRFGAAANAGEKQIRISERSKAALRKIAGHSKINALRLRRHDLAARPAATEGQSSA